VIKLSSREFQHLETGKRRSFCKEGKKKGWSLRNKVRKSHHGGGSVSALTY
jgi:hypothetical protein